MDRESSCGIQSAIKYEGVMMFELTEVCTNPALVVLHNLHIYPGNTDDSWAPNIPFDSPQLLRLVKLTR